MEFTADSLVVGFMATYFAYLYFKFRRHSKQLRIQQRRYPMFAARDRLVQMKLDGKISEELFVLGYRFCNNVLRVSDEMDLLHLATAMAKVAKDSRSRFSELAMEQAKKDPEFSRLYFEMVSHVIKWCVYNSLLKRPIPLLRLIVLGTAREYWGDFKQLLNTRRTILRVA